MRIPTTLRLDLAKLRRISEVLSTDTFFGLSEAQKAAKRQAAEQELSFWVKTTVRCLFGQVDALSFAMRRAVLNSADAVGLELRTKDRARLAERRYERERDSLGETPKHNSVEDNLKLAFRFFPQLFGSAYRLGAGGDEWRRFKRLIRTRHGITHPKRLEDLVPIEVVQLLEPCIMWYGGEIVGLLQDCEAQIRSEPSQRSQTPRPGPETDEVIPSPIDEQFYDTVRSNAVASLAFLGKVRERLSFDTRESLRLLGESLKQDKSVSSQMVQFHLRNSTRTLFSEVEGTINALSDFMEAAQARGEVQLGDLSADDLSQRLAVVLREYIAKFGKDYELATTGVDWERFRAGLKLRDQITHPKAVGDLHLKMKSVKTLLGGHRWFCESLHALVLDRWPSQPLN